MSMDDIPIGPDMQQSLDRGGIDLGNKKKKSKQPEREPAYAMIGDTRVPVSKHIGKLWKSRRDAAKKRREETGISDAWAEALKYYNNDQTGHRSSGDPDRAQNINDGIHEEYTETENIVFANTSALVPAIYSKNPVIEVTATVESMKPLATQVERLGNKLLGKVYAPGINLKPKMKQAIVLATLTNTAWIETGWNSKELSSGDVLNELAKLGEALTNAKSPQEIETIEGKIAALEYKTDYAEPSGPFAKVRRPQDILVIGDCDNPYAMIDMQYMPTSLLKALYSKESEDNRPMSIFAPTHVLNVGKEAKSIDDEVSSFTLLASDETDDIYKKYGYEDTYTYKRNQYTRVARVWDKTTRRLYLFNDNDWSWPLWVWEDPYGLPGFFPFSKLQFITDPLGYENKGEVVYYLDQQDALNTINSERHRMRRWAQRNIVFDSNRVSATDVAKMISGNNDGAVGINVPDGGTMDDMLKVLVPPSANLAQLFDKNSILEAVDRLSSVRGVMRGAEFRTNTTNEAIRRYDAVSETRLDEKIDAVEDVIADVAGKVLFLCLRFMDAEMAGQLIDIPVETPWQTMTPQDINKLDLTIVGGSTQKPSRQMKMDEGLKAGQVLGQFASASPAALIVALKVLEESFDSITITAEDWMMIRQSIETQVQGQQGGDAQGIMQQYDALPPEAKLAFGKATAQGVPAQEALAQIGKAVSGGGEQPPTETDQPPALPTDQPPSDVSGAM